MAVRSKYQPFSFQERITPLAMLQEQYDKTNENLLALGEQAMQYYRYLDPETKAAVDQYNAELSNVASSLASEGMKAVSRNTLTRLRTMYNDRVKPINEAAQTLSKMYEDQRSLESKLNASGQRLFSSAMPTVKDLLENPGATPQNVGSGALYAQGQAASKSASMRKFYESAFGEEIVNGYINQVKEQGYSPEVIARFMRDVNTIPELRDAYNSIRAMYGTANLINPDEADQFIMQGLLDGIVYNRETTQKEDIIGKENRAYARQVALANLNADLDLRNALAKEAGKNQDSSSARLKTIVSPRAVSTVSQQFYDAKANTVKVPDYLFDKNGHLAEPKRDGKYTPGAITLGRDFPEYDARVDQYNSLMKALEEGFSKEEIAKMSKDEVTKALEGIVHNSLQDAQGNSALYWNLDPTDTKELLSRVGDLYEVQSKENGKWRYSTKTKNVRSEQKDKGSELVYDPVSNELFIGFDGSKKMYRLDKSVIGDSSILEGLGHYHDPIQDLGGMNLTDYSRDIISEYGQKLQELTDKYNKTGKLTPEEQQQYSEAYEIYNQAVENQESAYTLYSSIGPTIQTYLKKRNE